MNPFCTAFRLAFALLMVCNAVIAQPAISAEAVFPAPGWQRIERAESVGYSPQKLAVLRDYLATIDTTAMMVVVGGRSLFEYGDLAHISVLASVRKSVLAMLYGKYVDDGTIRPDLTLAALGFDDISGLSPAEKQATIEHLLTARSGIYHPAANTGDDTSHALPRDSVIPGSKHLYNNWDFNAAGAVFERLVKRDIYDALDTDLARPLGMEDFDRSIQLKSGNLKRSRHPAYHMRMSTRDMARLGLLMLRDGRWNGKQIMPAGWSGKITRLVTPYNELIPERRRRLGDERWGYGYMWWVWDATKDSEPMVGAYTARGLGGQFITVIPRLDMVIAHKTDARAGGDETPRRKRVSAAQYAAVVRMIIDAHCAASGCS